MLHTPQSCCARSTRRALRSALRAASGQAFEPPLAPPRTDKRQPKKRQRRAEARLCLAPDLQRSEGLALVFIAHDLAVVKHIADKVVVMYLGRTMETAPTNALFDTPTHPYTQALLSAVPVPDPHIERNKAVQILEGDIPSPINPPSGCVFRTRCPKADESCANSRPPLIATADSHHVACLRVQ